MLEKSMLNNLLINPAYIIAGLGGLTALLLLMVIVSLFKMAKLKKQYSKFMMGSEAVSLEEMIQNQAALIDKLNRENAEIQKKIQDMDNNIQICYQKTGIEKYDALKGLGGQISFAMALLDKSNTGIIMNSIHTREGSYLYMKTIENGKCELTLGREEEKALEKAIAK